MKAKVLRQFRDKHSGKMHKAGDILTISKARYEEILKVGRFVAKIEEKKAPQSNQEGVEI